MDKLCLTQISVEDKWLEVVETVLWLTHWLMLKPHVMWLCLISFIVADNCALHVLLLSFM